MSDVKPTRAVTYEAVTCDTCPDEIPVGDFVWLMAFYKLAGRPSGIERRCTGCVLLQDHLPYWEADIENEKRRVDNDE